MLAKVDFALEELAMFLLHGPHSIRDPSTSSSETETLNMAITEQNRRDIFNRLEDAIGTEQANHLMELLPTSPASQLVTRTDMHAFGTEIRGEMAELRGEMAELRAELRGDMAELRGEIHTKLANAHASTQRLIIASMIGNAVAVFTALTV